MEQEALHAFAQIIQGVSTLPADQVSAVLAVCRELDKLPSDAVRWVRDTATLIQENDAAKAFLEDLIELVDYKVQKQGSSKLKRRVLMDLVKVIVFHKRKSFHFLCDGELAQFLCGIDETVARDYYNKSVVGVVFDKLGQRINIWKYAVRHLYKDKAEGHTVAPEFFQAARAKRLPWIRHVLTNSTEIYEEWGRGRFGKPNLVYVGQTVIGVDKPKYSQYFLVFVESNRSQKLGLVTAFTIEKRKDFLRLLAQWTPRVMDPTDTALEHFE